MGGGVVKRALTRTKIEWCDCTWNPVWGCRNACSYCYARRTAKRWGLQVCGRDDFVPTWVQSNYEKKFPQRPSRIFVNSMSDVAFWEDEWLVRVLRRIMGSPDHTFLMLTKEPDCYGRFDSLAPENLWLGVTATRRSLDDLKRCWRMYDMKYRRWFVSVEPMHGPLGPHLVGDPPWAILGAETGNRKERVVVRREWLDEWLKYAGPVFMKDSLIPIVGEENMRREFPGNYTGAEGRASTMELSLVGGEMKYRILEDGNNVCWVERKIGPFWLRVRDRACRRRWFDEYVNALKWLEVKCRNGIENQLWYADSRKPDDLADTQQAIKNEE